MTYRAALLQLVRRCREVVEEALPAIEAQWPRPSSDGTTRVADSYNPSIATFVRRASAKLGNLDEWAKRMVGIAVELNKDSVDARLARVIREAIGVDVSHILHGDTRILQAMREATKTNIALIKTIPEQYLFGLRDEKGKLIRHGVEDVITDAWSRGERWESVVEQVAAVGGVTENRAKLIARDQTAKMNADFNRERCNQVGIERGEWMTSQDERVRPSHAAMEGVVFDLNGEGPLINEDGEHCFPGGDYQCRCDFAPVVDMEALELQAGLAEQEQEIAA